MRVNPAKRHRVAIVLSEGLSAFEFGVACEVFGVDRSELGVPWYRSFVCAVEPGPVSAESGFSVVAPYGLDTLARADTIVVIPPGNDVEHPPALLAALGARPQAWEAAHIAVHRSAGAGSRRTAR